MNLLETIKSRVNIVDEIEDRIEIIRRGRSISALCPFHDDKNPSLTISESKQLFKCFSCGMGGDVVKFVMEYEKIPFKTTLKKLAVKYGIPLPSNFNLREAIMHDAHISEKTMHEQAMDLYQRYLLQALKAREGRDYLKKRKISRELIERFKIGFACSSFRKNFLFQYLLKKNSAEKILSTNLVKKNNYGEEQDFFYKRIMFPIRNEKSEVLGFGGRAIQDEQMPKYINSPESGWFKKGELLYGLYESYQLMIKKKIVYIVEGYFDVMALYNIELPAVSPLGTSLTLEQTRKLKRYADKIYLVMDSDEAGVKATLRAIAHVLQLELDAYVISLPSGQDPFDFVQGKKKNEVINFFEEREKHVYDYVIAQFDPSKTNSDNEKKKYFLEVLNFFSLVKDDFLRENFSEKIKEKFKIAPLDYLKRNYLRKKPLTKFKKPEYSQGFSQSFREGRKGREGRESSGVRKPENTMALSLKERELVIFLCQHPAYINKARSTLSKNNFVDQMARYIFQKLVENFSPQIKKIQDVFALFVDPQEKVVVDFITSKLLEQHPERSDANTPNTSNTSNTPNASNKPKPSLGLGPNYIEELFQNKIAVIKINHIKLRKQKITELIKESSEVGSEVRSKGEREGEADKEIYDLMEEKQTIIQEEENLKKFLEEKPFS